MRLLAMTTAATILLGATSVATGSDAEERKLRQAMGYSQRGLRSLEKGNRARAAEDFERALAQVPDLPDAHAGLGHIAMQDRRFEDALEAYRRAQQSYRAFASQRVDLAQERYARSRDQLQLLKDQKNSIEREQLSAQARGGSITDSGGSSEGRLQRTRLQFEREIAQLESQNAPALEASDGEPPAGYHFFEANALFNLKRNDEAIAAWTRAVERDPAYGVAFNNLAVAYWMAGRLEDAQASLARADRLGFKVNPSFRADLQKSVASRSFLKP